MGAMLESRQAMNARKPSRVEQKLTDQVEALRSRLTSTAKRRKELEARIDRLRSRLRAEETRLESEKEQEDALKMALKMAELALNLASGNHEAQVDLSEAAIQEEVDWEDLTIAEACRRLLHANFDRPMTNRELQDALMAEGKNVPLGSIPTTLDRYRHLFRKEKRGNVIYWSLNEDERAENEASSRPSSTADAG